MLMPPMPKLMPLSLHLHLLHLSIMLPLLLHLYLVNLLLGMNSATPNTVIPTGRLPNTKGNGFGQKTGSYQYVDPNGELQTVTYVADEFGFRTEDSRLPVAPVHNAELPVAPVHEYELPVAPVHEYTLPVAPVFDGVAPIAPEKTPEVVAAEAEHLAAVAEVTASRAKRESDPMHSGYGYNSPWIVNPMYQRRLYNGIYAYNQLGYMGTSRFGYGFYY